MIAYLGGADLVERDKGERLRQHGGGEVLLGDGEGDEQAGEEELGEEGEGLGVPRGGGGGGGGVCRRVEVEEGVVGGEVVAVVDAGDVVEVCVEEEWVSIP